MTDKKSEEKAEGEDSKGSAPKLEVQPAPVLVPGAAPPVLDKDAEDAIEEEVRIEKPIVPVDDTDEKKKEPEKAKVETNIFALRTTANREDQVMEFVTSNAAKKEIPVFAVIRPHGMRGYIFLEAENRTAAEEAVHGIPYARGILPKQVEYAEIEHMLEQVKKDINMQKNDIVEIISGAFKREKAKVTRIDKAKEEVVVELLEAAVPIPITLKIDAVKVIRRPGEDES
ncbi:transcription elongation factor Spt5 [Nanoarchaeota archaeon]